MDAQTAESLSKFAEDAGAGLRGLDSKAVFQQLDERYVDLKSALQWFIDEGRADEAFRLASAIVPFWMATKRLDEGSSWFDRVLALTGGEESRRGRAMFEAGYIAFWKGDDERSASMQNRAVEIGLQIKDPTVTALALVGLARIALRTNVDEARQLCREALTVTEGTQDRLGGSSAMHVLAVASQMAGDLVEAGEMMRRRIALARETGNFAVISVESGNLSMVERQLGNFDQAEALAREALEIDYRRGDGQSIPWKVNGLAAVAKDRGDLERAATLIGVADATLKAAGGAWPPDEREHYEKTVAALIETMGTAAFDRARAAGHSMTVAQAIAFALGRAVRTG